MTVLSPSLPALSGDFRKAFEICRHVLKVAEPSVRTFYMSVIPLLFSSWYLSFNLYHLQGNLFRMAEDGNLARYEKKKIHKIIRFTRNLRFNKLTISHLV